jgi:hypothetical protein
MIAMGLDPQTWPRFPEVFLPADFAETAEVRIIRDYGMSLHPFHAQAVRFPYVSDRGVNYNVHPKS